MKKLVCLIAATALVAGAAHAQIKPYITPNTVRVTVPEDTEINAVSEGVVTLMSDYRMAFYNIKTQQMFGDFTYQYLGNVTYKQKFSGGAITVKTQETPEGSYSRQTYYHIISPNGKDNKLDPEQFREVMPFVDGIAPAKKSTGAWSGTPAFIDRNGKEVLGHLLEGKSVYEWKVGPLQDGMRAVYVDKWGFVDESGKVIIEPQYKKASNFSEGYALVSTDGSKYGIIDKSGKMVVPETIEAGWEEPRDFHCGWAYLPSKERFVDTKGNLSPEVEAVTDFYEGFALVKTGYNKFGIMDSKLFATLLEIKPDLSPVVMRDAPKYFIDGFYLLDAYGGNYLINQLGIIILKASGNCQFTGIWDDGLLSLYYDTADDLYGPAHESYAICDFKGEILVIFDRKGKFPQVKKAEPVDPEPGDDPEEPGDDPEVPGDDPEEPRPPVPEPKPEKPGQEPEKTSEFTLKDVTVIYDEPFSGAKGADVYCNIGIGEAVHRGDSLIIGIVPKDPDASAGLLEVTVRNADKTNPLKMKPNGPGLYAAKISKDGDVYVNVHIRMPEKPEIKEVYTLGTHVDFSKQFDDIEDMEADIYFMADPAGIKDTPFGDDVKGLFVVDFPATQKVTPYFNGDPNKPLRHMLSYYWGPFNLEGLYEEGGKKYIYMEGGIAAAGNWMNYEEGGDLAGIFITLMMSMSSMNDKKTDGDPTYIIMTLPHRYRLSYEDLPDGGMKLGYLQRYADGIGWVSPDDKRLITRESKDIGFMTIHDQDEVPMEYNCLAGIELHKIPMPKKLPPFYPGRNWFSSSEHYNHTIEVFNTMYGYHPSGEKPATQEECKTNVTRAVSFRNLKKIK